MPAVSSLSRALGAEKLRWSKYSAPYKRRLIEGCKCFEEYLAAADVSLEALLEQKPRVIDEVTEQFVKIMHDDEKRSSLRIVKHAVLTLQIVKPQLRRKLPATWEAIKAWEEMKPSNFRPPVPVALLMAIVCRAMLRSEKCDHGREAVRWRAFGTLVLLGFYGLLRPGELLGLKASDAVPPNSWSLGNDFAVIRLERPKNSRQMGVQQYVEIRHPDAINWLSWLKNERPTNAALWDSTANRFRNMFRKICQELGIHSLHLSPASLRAGGATWLVDEGTEIGKVRFLGRWANLRSLEHYIQVARAQQISLLLPQATAHRLKRFLSRYHFLVHLPIFLAEAVPAENLLVVDPGRPFESSHAVAATRAWSRSQAVQKGDRQCWTAERSSLHRRVLGRSSKGSQELQA